MFEHKSLSHDEARDVLLNIADGKYNDSQLSAFMTVYLMRSITIDELTGFRDAILERRLPVEFGDVKSIDIVGTGGDGKHIQHLHSELLCSCRHRKKSGEARQLWCKLSVRRLQCA